MRGRGRALPRAVAVIEVFGLRVDPLVWWQRPRGHLRLPHQKFHARRANPNGIDACRAKSLVGTAQREDRRHEGNKMGGQNSVWTNPALPTPKGPCKMVKGAPLRIIAGGIAVSLVTKGRTDIGIAEGLIHIVGGKFRQRLLEWLHRSAERRSMTRKYPNLKKASVGALP